MQGRAEVGAGALWEALSLPPGVVGGRCTFSVAFPAGSHSSSRTAVTAVKPQSTLWGRTSHRASPTREGSERCGAVRGCAGGACPLLGRDGTGRAAMGRTDGRMDGRTDGAAALGGSAPVRARGGSRVWEVPGSPGAALEEWHGYSESW